MYCSVSARREVERTLCSVVNDVVYVGGEMCLACSRCRSQRVCNVVNDVVYVGADKCLTLTVGLVCCPLGSQRGEVYKGHPGTPRT